MTQVTIEEKDGEYIVTGTTDRQGNYTSVEGILDDIVAVCRALKPHLERVDLNIPAADAGQIANLILLDLLMEDFTDED